MMAPEDKPYSENVWWLKRVGLSLGGLGAAAVIALIANGLGVSGVVVSVFFIAAIVVVFAYIACVMVAMWRYEKRRQSAVRVLHRDAADRPAVSAPVREPARHRVGRASWVMAAVLLCGIPLIVVGVTAGLPALRDAGLALVIIQLLVMAILDPLLTARTARRRRERRAHPENGGPAGRLPA